MWRYTEEGGGGNGKLWEEKQMTKQENQDKVWKGDSVMTQGFLMTCGGSVQSRSTTKAEMLKDKAGVRSPWPLPTYQYADTESAAG